MSRGCSPFHAEEDRIGTASSEKLLLGRQFEDDGTPFLELRDAQPAAARSIAQKIRRGEFTFEPAACLCGADPGQVAVLSHKDRYGLPVRVVLCMACSLVFQQPRLDPRSAATFYASDYRALDDELWPEEAFRSQYERGRAVLEFVQETLDPTGMRVLDCGCFAGGTLQAFRERGCLVSGFDMDEKFVAFGAAKGLDLARSTFDDFMAGAERRYDLVLMSHVLEHLSDPAAALDAVRRVLRPAGYLYVEVPNVDPRFSLLAPRFGTVAWKGELQLAHNWYFDEPTLSALLLSRGFRVLRCRKPFHMSVLASPVEDRVGGEPCPALRAVDARRKHHAILANLRRDRAVSALEVIGLKRFITRLVRRGAAR